MYLFCLPRFNQQLDFSLAFRFCSLLYADLISSSHLLKNCILSMAWTPIQKSFCVETYLSTKSYILTQRLDHICASHSPDLNLLIFLFLGVYLKDRVSRNQPMFVEKLKNEILQGMSGISLQICREMMNNFT